MEGRSIPFEHVTLYAFNLASICSGGVHLYARGRACRTGFPEFRLRAMAWGAQETEHDRAHS